MTESDTMDRDRMHEVRLPARYRWPILGLALALFAVGGGRWIWESPFDVDRAVWLSYFVIPPLVLIALWHSGRLSWVSALLNIMELTLIKFGITYAFAIAMWALSDPPVRPQWTPTMRPKAAAQEPAPTTSPWSGGRMILDARVTRGGEPVAQAFVYVDGLEDLTFAPRRAPRLELPSASRSWIAHTHDELQARSTDGALHPLKLLSDRREAVRPLLADGSWQRLGRLPTGITEVKCELHDEPHHYVLVLHHPFAAVTGRDGQAHIVDVPAEAAELRVWHPTLGEAVQPVDVAACSAGCQFTIALDG